MPLAFTVTVDRNRRTKTADFIVRIADAERTITKSVVEMTTLKQDSNCSKTGILFGVR